MYASLTPSPSIRAALGAVLALAVALPALAQHAAAHGGGGGGAGGGHVAAPAGAAHQHFDGRFSHDRYYYDHGYSVRQPPRGSFGELHGSDGGRYWYHGGNWYRWGGHGWVVWGAPIGLLVPWLPPYYTTVWWYGAPYYYANDTYYVWDADQGQYQVVAPPDGLDSSGSTRPPVSDQLFVYPKNGQSEAQQQQDKYDCHRWAVLQSGFDPTAAAAPVDPEKRDDYFRAQVSCLEGHGYVVR